MKKFWIAFAVGAFVGGVATLLYAPQSGASTRRKVRRGLQDLGDNLGDAAEYLKEQAERLASEAQKLIDGSKSQIDVATSAASDYLAMAKNATETATRNAASRIM